MAKIRGNVGVIGSPVIQNRVSFNNNILREMSFSLNKALYETSKSPSVRVKVEGLIASAIRNSAECSSLLNGKLRYEFGLVNPAPAVDAIIRAVQNGVVISADNVKILGGALVGGFVKVEFLQTDLSEVINLPEGSYQSKGGEVRWLEWLLTFGDAIILSQYAISEYIGQSDDSRTGEAVMVRSRKGWRVPPEFSGTIANNWLTRAFDDADIEVVICNVLGLDFQGRL